MFVKQQCVLDRIWTGCSQCNVCGASAGDEHRTALMLLDGLLPLLVFSSFVGASVRPSPFLKRPTDTADSNTMSSLSLSLAVSITRVFLLGLLSAGCSIAAVLLQRS